MYDRLDEFVRYFCVIAGLHRFVHVLESSTCAVYQQVVSYFDALPAFVTVHGIETTADRSDLTGRFRAMCLELVNESDTRTRVGITTVHEAMDEGFALQFVFSCYVAEIEQVLEAGVHSSVRSEAHEMDLLAVLLSVTADGFDLRIF